MFWLLFSLAQAATPTTEPVDATAISAATDACLAAVRTDFEGGAVLPSRAAEAAINAELCSKEPALGRVAIKREREAKVAEHREVRVRLDAATAAKTKRPALSGYVTVEDEFISSSLDRARASQVQEPESPDVALALGLWADIERLSAEFAVLDAAVKRVSEEVQRYFALRDGLWMMDCTGEIDLVYPETMPNDARYSYEEQCRQLTQRQNGIQGVDTTSRDPGNPGAARR